MISFLRHERLFFSCFLPTSLSAKCRILALWMLLVSATAPDFTTDKPANIQREIVAQQPVSTESLPYSLPIPKDKDKKKKKREGRAQKKSKRSEKLKGGKVRNYEKERKAIKRKKRAKLAGRIILSIFILLIFIALVAGGLWLYLKLAFDISLIVRAILAAVAALIVMAVVVFAFTIPNRAKRIKRKWRWLPDWVGSLLAVFGFAVAIGLGALVVKYILSLAIGFSSFALLVAVVLLPALVLGFVFVHLLLRYIKKPQF